MTLSKFRRSAAIAVMALAHVLCAGLMLGSIAACSSFGQQAPKSAEDSLQYAKASLAGAYKTVGDALASGALRSAQAKPMLTQLDVANAGLTDAAALIASGIPGDTATAIGKVNAALVVLQQVQTLLNAYAQKPPAAAAPPASAASAG
jgi:hypothetical protein